MIENLKLALASALLVCGLVGCSGSNERDYSLHLTETEMVGPGTLGLSNNDLPVKGLIIYFHGSDQTARVIRDDQKHRDFFDPLLRVGYAVVAADARGNAFGNPASRADYRRLLAVARSKYSAEPVFFVAESMGALAALALLADATDRMVRGMVGISPLMGLPPVARSASFIAGAWGGSVPDMADPLSWPPETFADRNFRLYSSKDDHTIPPEASAHAFADRFGSVAKIELVECTGGHVSAACYQGTDVEKWFDSLGQ